MTEVAAYPAFIWALLALYRATVRRSSARWDAARAGAGLRSPSSPGPSSSCSSLVLPLAIVCFEIGRADGPEPVATALVREPARRWPAIDCSRAPTRLLVVGGSRGSISKGRLDGRSSGSTASMHSSNSTRSARASLGSLATHIALLRARVRRLAFPDRGSLAPREHRPPGRGPREPRLRLCRRFRPARHLRPGERTSTSRYNGLCPRPLPALPRAAGRARNVLCPRTTASLPRWSLVGMAAVVGDLRLRLRGVSGFHLAAVRAR